MGMGIDVGLAINPEEKMKGPIADQTRLNDFEGANPFNSVSSYLTLALTGLLPVGLWLTQKSLRSVFADFEFDVTQLTIWFLNPAMPFALLILPLCVVATEFLIGNQVLRNRCDTVLATLAIISLVFVGLAFGVPMFNLINGLQG
jgi:hypothetical protein